MTNQFQCRTCKAIYYERTPEGGIYFHRCRRVFHPVTAAVSELPDYRDENLVLGRRGEAVDIRSEGAGVDPVAPTTATQPAWISAMQARVGKDD